MATQDVTNKDKPIKNRIVLQDIKNIGTPIHDKLRTHLKDILTHYITVFFRGVLFIAGLFIVPHRYSQLSAQPRNH